MPPVVTGGIVAAIGLVLAPIAIGSASGTGPSDPNGSGFARFIALLTVVAVGAVAVYAPGLWRRLPILVGGAVAYLAYLILANGLGFGAPIDFTKVGAAAWFGLPNFTSPVFTLSAISLIAPVAVILVAENLGHI
jgi:putative pyrimidine permease RutG